MDEATERYQAQMDMLVQCCLSLDYIDFEWLLETVRRSETVALILYPSEYRKSTFNLRDQRRILEAAKTLKDTVVEVRASRV